MKYKVLVPDAEKILRAYYHVCTSSLEVHLNDIKTRIIKTLYIKALLGEKKVLISALCKGYYRKDILDVYETIIWNVDNF